MHCATLSPAQERAYASYAHLGLWTFQGWIAMFFTAAGYAKLTESMANLTALMTWPQWAGEALTRSVGGVELLLGLAMLAPLISWRIGRPVVIAAAAVLVVWQGLMLGFHAWRLDIGLGVLNLALLAITLPVFMGRRRLPI